MVGYIEINATGSITIDDSLIANITGGNIEINTNSLEIVNEGKIVTRTQGEGNAGLVDINATGIVRIEGEIEGGDQDGKISGIYSFVDETGLGNAAGININASQLEAINGGQILSSTLGEGDAGRVTINSTGIVRFEGETNPGMTGDSGAFSTVQNTATGNAGGIEITAESVEVLNGAKINANTFGIGDGGDISIQTTRILRLDGYNSAIVTQIEENGVGDTGNIEISANSIEATNGSLISTSIFAEGNAGSIIITNTESILIDSSSQISTQIVETGISDSPSNIVIET